MQKIQDRKKQPGLKQIEKIFIPQAEKHTLDNGIPVYVVNAGFQDLVKVDLVFKNLQYDASKPLLSSATSRMLAEGTSKHSALELADMVDYYGAFYGTEEGADYCSVNLFTLNKHLSKTLPAFREIITEAVFPQAELDTFILNNNQRILVENEKVMSVARKKFNQLLFGDEHPYGHSSTTADYDNIRREHLVDYHRRQYVSEHCIMIISGRIHDETLRHINQYLGDKTWSRSNGKESSMPAVNTNPSRKNFEVMDGAIQSAIRIGKKTITRKHEDYPGLSFLNTIFGGYFGSRLMSNIREDKGFTYGINSGIVSLAEHGYFFITTEIGVKVTQDAIREIYKEMNLLREEIVEKDELETVRNYMLGSFIKNLETAFHISDRFKSIHMNGLGYDYYDRYLDKIRTIKAEEIRELARKYLDPDSMIELVVGPK